MRAAWAGHKKASSFLGRCVVGSAISDELICSLWELVQPHEASRLDLFLHTCEEFESFVSRQSSSFSCLHFTLVDPAGQCAPHQADGVIGGISFANTCMQHDGHKCRVWHVWFRRQHELICVTQNVDDACWRGRCGTAELLIQNICTIQGFVEFLFHQP